MFELSGVYSYVSIVEGSGGMPNLFELARVRVIACSSYRDSTVPHLEGCSISFSPGLSDIQQRIS